MSLGKMRPMTFVAYRPEVGHSNPRYIRTEEVAANDDAEC